MLQSLWEAIKSIFGFGSDVAKNQAQKIPMKEPAIREKAETKVVKENNKQHRLKQVIPKEQIEAEVYTLGLKNRFRRQLTNILHNIIKSGGTINTIEWHKDKDNKVDKVIYCYTDKHGVGKSGEF